MDNLHIYPLVLKELITDYINSNERFYFEDDSYLFEGCKDLVSELCEKISTNHERRITSDSIVISEG